MVFYFFKNGGIKIYTFLKFDVSATRIEPTYRNVLTTGLTGAVAEFTFTSDWDKLTKVAVFESNGVIRSMLIKDDACEIPPEVMATVNNKLFVAVQGTLNGEIVIPTIYTDCGSVLRGANPENDTDTPLTPSLYQQLMAEFNRVALITKEYKDSAIDSANIATTKATESTEASLTAIEKAYETSQDAIMTEQDRQEVHDNKIHIDQQKELIDETARSLLSQKGMAGGIATLDATGKVAQTANNADRLNNKDITYFSTAQELNELTVTVNQKVQEVFVDGDGNLNVKINEQVAKTLVDGLISSFTFDGNTGDIVIGLKGNKSLSVNIGKDNFVSSGYYDSTTNDIVLVMTNGSEIRIPASGLINTYVGGETNSIKVDIDGYTVYADVKISKNVDNCIIEKSDGLYVAPTDLSEYKTKTENDNLYLGKTQKAVNSSLLDGKTESDLNVNNAQTADKLANKRTISFKGVSRGSGDFDGSSNIEINLSHIYIPPTIIADSTSITWDVKESNFAVSTLTAEATLTILNITAGFYGIYHTYGHGFNLDNLALDGWVIDPTAEFLNTNGDINKMYVHTFAYDGVKKSYRRTVVG